MPFIQNLACMHMGMTMEEVLAATTINAAYAINRGAEIGSLERGKKADILILDVSNYKQLQYFYGMRRRIPRANRRRQTRACTAHRWAVCSIPSGAP